MNIKEEEGEREEKLVLFRPRLIGQPSQFKIMQKKELDQRNKERKVRRFSRPKEKKTIPPYLDAVGIEPTTFHRQCCVHAKRKSLVSC